MHEDEIDEVDESPEDPEVVIEEAESSREATPQPPYGPDIARRWRNTPFEELPERLQDIVRGG